MKNSTIITIVLILTIVGIVSAADWTPTGDINMRGVYQIKNATNVTAQYWCNATTCYTMTQLLADTDTDTNTLYYAGGVYLYLNGSNAFFVNETRLNATIDARATATSYLADGIYIYLSGVTFTLNETKLNNTVAILIPDNLSQFVDNLGNRGYTSLSNFTNNMGFYNSTNINSSELQHQGDGKLGILDSFINTLIDNRVVKAFVKALGFYDNTEVYNKTETYNKTEVHNKTYSDTIYYLSSNPSNFWNNTFATFNKTYADTLYAGIEWDYNQTTSANAYSDSLLITTIYNASAIQVVTGTPQGAIANLQTYDSTSYNVSEASSDIDLRVNFSSITTFNQIIVRYKSDSAESHTMDIALWDYVNGVWESYRTVGVSPDYNIMTMNVYDITNHISGGVVQVRFYTLNSGGLTHKHQFDWVAISKGVATPSSSETDPYSLHKDGATQLTANWDQGDFNLTNVNSWFLGKINHSNIQNLPAYSLAGNCTSGQVVMNTTNSGVQCVAQVTDTNETTRFNALTNGDCGAGYLVIGVQTNGTVLCAEDSTGAPGAGDIEGVIAGTGLFGGGTTGTVTLNVSADTCGAGNVSKYNGTGFACVVDVDTNTVYTAGANLTLTGEEFSLNATSLKEWLDGVYAGIGTIFDGTWASLTGKPTHLSNFTDNLGNRGYTSVSNFTNDLNFVNATTIGNTTIVRAGTYNCTNGNLLQNVTINSSGIFGSCRSLATSETDPKAYNGTLAYNSSLANYYLNSNPSGFLNLTNSMNTTQLIAAFVNRSLWTTIDNYPTACGAGLAVGTIGDTLTCINPVASSDATWTLHGSYPAACSAGQYVSTIGDTNICSAPTEADPLAYNGTLRLTSNSTFPTINVSTHFSITTANITCLNTACTWYTNATDSCMYWPSGGRDCGA